MRVDEHAPLSTGSRDGRYAAHSPTDAAASYHAPHQGSSRQTQWRPRPMPLAPSFCLPPHRPSPSTSSAPPRAILLRHQCTARGARVMTPARRRRGRGWVGNRRRWLEGSARPTHNPGMCTAVGRQKTGRPLPTHPPSPRPSLPWMKDTRPCSGQLRSPTRQTCPHRRFRAETCFESVAGAAAAR